MKRRRRVYASKRAIERITNQANSQLMEQKSNWVKIGDSYINLHLVVLVKTFRCDAGDTVFIKPVAGDNIKLKASEIGSFLDYMDSIANSHSEETNHDNIQ